MGQNINKTSAMQKLQDQRKLQIYQIKQQPFNFISQNSVLLLHEWRKNMESFIFPLKVKLLFSHEVEMLLALYSPVKLTARRPLSDIPINTKCEQTSLYIPLVSIVVTF